MVIIYLEDIIYHSKSFIEQLKHLEVVFKRLSDANLKLNPKKVYTFSKKSSHFFGHVINENGVVTDPVKIEILNIGLHLKIQNKQEVLSHLQAITEAMYISL